MNTIKDLVAINKEYINDNLFGLEIEVEGSNLPNALPPAYWRVEKDSSLKTAEAWEYVTPKPFDLKTIRKALDVLDSAYQLHLSNVHDSVRAGVHVHLNVQKWTIKQLMTYATSYYLLEDILLRFCGENREGNLFCLRTRDAEYVLFKLLDVLKTRNLKPLNTDIIRYASLNYLSLFKYGTVEFRGMRGTRDLNLIYKWVSIVDELRRAVDEFTDPLDVISSMSGDGELSLIKRLLPSFYEELIAIYGPDFDKSIRDNARRVQMIAFGIDWNTIGRPKVNIFEEGNGF